jgi:hypothetical protein
MKYVKHLLSILIIVFIALFVYVIFVFIAKPMDKVWCPEDGVWYCEELQIQISFEPGKKSYAVLDGTVVPCVCENDRGSKDLLVLCQANGNGYAIGEIIFSGRYVDLSNDTYVLKNKKSQELYTFVRTE